MKALWNSERFWGWTCVLLGILFLVIAAMAPRDPTWETRCTQYHEAMVTVIDPQTMTPKVATSLVCDKFEKVLVR